jgi:phage head maturation protease
MPDLNPAFDTATMDVSAIPGGTVFDVNVEQRTIRGRAVPYGVVGVKNGLKFQFSKGTIRAREGMKVKLWGLHDKLQASGVVTEWNDTDGGLDVAFRVAKTPEGDRALTMADEGVWDGLSIGPSEGAKYALRDGIYHSVDIPIHEISLTPAPVFGGARVQSVTFDAITEGNTMPCSKCGKVHANGVTECNAADVTAFEASKDGATDFSVIGDAIGDAIQAGFASMQLPQPEKIGAGHQLQVTEELPYRFDGAPGKHSFSQDIRDAYMSHDNEAKQRLESFIDEAFAVTSGNVATLNPTQNRPELYVPNLAFTRPLWELVSTGVVTDKTPFTVPKFSSASGLVGAHTEGVEPTPGAFAATSQTVSPLPLSGKIEINREVWDQGGSPQADAIIWGEMLNGWYEAIEAKIATQLAATATAELNLAGVVDAPLVTAMTSYFAGLQFVRGGNRFTAFASDGKLFPALVGAKDSAGRNLLPVVGPANAQGQTSGGFDRVQIGNQTVRAAWALAQGTNTRSYSFVPSSVWCWASAPKRFTFEYQVKSIDMAIWGYAGTAILRDSDVKPVDYDTSDA